MEKSLKEWRISKELTQKQAGAIFGCSTVSISRYENFTRSPNRASVVDTIFLETNGDVTANAIYRHTPARLKELKELKAKNAAKKSV